MTEVQFARVFLSALDARPIKLSSDSIADQRQLPSSIGYTLPKYPSSPIKRKRNNTSTATDSAGGAASSSASSGPSTAIKLSYPKSAEHSLAIDVQPLSSSIYDLKNAYATAYHVPVDKIKLLFAKRPVADSKTLADVLGSGANAGGQSGAVAEFSVMLLGGAVPSTSAPEPAAAGSKPAVQEATRIPVGKELETDEFWTDLQGYLMQRLKDEKEAERLAKLFRKAASS